MDIVQLILDTCTLVTVHPLQDHVQRTPAHQDLPGVFAAFPMAEEVAEHVAECDLL